MRQHQRISQESVGPVLIGTSSLMDKEAEKVKVPSAFLPCSAGKVGSQAPKFLQRGRIQGRKCSPLPRKRETRTVQVIWAFADLWDRTGCVEGGVWCDCGATVCHLGSRLKAGRRQMLNPPLKRARRRMQRTTDRST